MPGNNDPWQEVRDDAEQISARLVELLLLRDASAGIPQRRPLCHERVRALPRPTAQGGRARQSSVLLRCDPRRTRRAASRTPAPTCPAVGLAVKPVGEPDAGDRHVRFDERGWETERWPRPQATAPILNLPSISDWTSSKRHQRGDAALNGGLPGDKCASAGDARYAQSRFGLSIEAVMVVGSSSRRVLHLSNPRRCAERARGLRKLIVGELRKAVFSRDAVFKPKFAEWVAQHLPSPEALLEFRSQ